MNPQIKKPITHTFRKVRIGLDIHLSPLNVHAKNHSSISVNELDVFLLRGKHSETT